MVNQTKFVDKKTYEELLKSQIGSVSQCSDSVEDVKKARKDLSN